jgi:3-(3-hydroxy-phenyl)propionate hydroxylase
MRKAKVIVAGAGPAGCVAAYRLAQAGIDVILLEAQPSCAEDMRASTLHPPTLDMLDALGVLPEIEAQGLKAPVYQYRNRDMGAVLAVDMSEIADVSKHPYRLQCEQYKLARLLSGRLAHHPHAKVAFSNRLLSFVQDADGVTVNTETASGIEAYRADYLIAADGASSTVRKWLDIPFEGFTYPEKFLTLSTAYPIERHFDNLAYVSYMASASEWCVLLRVPDFWRVLVPAEGEESDATLLSHDKKNAVFAGLIGEEAAATAQTYHRTIYRVHQRVATHYRKGRVVLVGDAAHLNNPLGGFGMNSGVHDAWNLTDKLMSIFLDKGAPDALLDHYDRQRRTVMHEFVQAQTILNKKMLEFSKSEDQRRNQAALERTLSDPDLRRAYLLRQSMYQSLEREREIA